MPDHLLLISPAAILYYLQVFRYVKVLNPLCPQSPKERETGSPTHVNKVCDSFRTSSSSPQWCDTLL